MTTFGAPPHAERMSTALAYPPEWDEVKPGRDYSAEWARRRTAVYARTIESREKLRQELGGKCKQCGATALLEFHHPLGRNWVARKANLEHRMRLYWRDHRRGLLELLCADCNKKAGAPRGYWQHSKGGKR